MAGPWEPHTTMGNGYGERIFNCTAVRYTINQVGMSNSNGNGTGDNTGPNIPFSSAHSGAPHADRRWHGAIHVQLDGIYEPGESRLSQRRAIGDAGVVCDGIATWHRCGLLARTGACLYCLVASPSTETARAANVGGRTPNLSTSAVFLGINFMSRYCVALGVGLFGTHLRDLRMQPASAGSRKAPVKGTVLLDNKPMPEGEISFEIEGFPPAILPSRTAVFRVTLPRGKTRSRSRDLKKSPLRKTSPKRRRRTSSRPSGTINQSLTQTSAQAATISSMKSPRNSRPVRIHRPIRRRTAPLFFAPLRCVALSSFGRRFAFANSQ